MNLKIKEAPYLVVLQWDFSEGNAEKAADVWKNSPAHLLLKNSVVYTGIKTNTVVVLYTIDAFDEIQSFLESPEFEDFRQKESPFMASDFHQSIEGLVETVLPRDSYLPHTEFMQLRTIEVPLADIDSYLEWRKRRIFAFVKKNDKVTSFLAFHSVFATEPGVLFVTEFEGDPDEYRNSFLTPEYQQIIKEAGHDHIKSGEKGLQTIEYKKA